MTRPLRISPEYVPLPNVKKMIALQDTKDYKKIEKDFFIIANELKVNRLKFDFSRFLKKSDSYFSQNESRMKNGGVNSIRIAKTIQNINEQYEIFMEQL